MTTEHEPKSPSDEAPSAAEVKRLIRRRLRKHGEHEHQGINIYPMMDMMTILLVFMVMQFAASTAAVVQESDELDLPHSVSELELDDAVPIQISRSEVVIDGTSALELRDGYVRPEDKQGGDVGMLITPVGRVMQRIRDQRQLIAERSPNRPFEGKVQIIADRRTPYRTIAEILYTVRQADFDQMRFVVTRE